MTLLDDGRDELTVTTNGSFTFKTPLAGGASYDVTVATQPTDELCTVTHGSGVANANVTSVVVSCVRISSIGGTLSGLNSGDSVTLLDNGKDALSLTANGKFAFSMRLPVGSAYKVTVGTEPVGEKCTITHGTGVVAGNVTNIAVSCATAPTHTIGGTVSGLTTGDSVTLLDNGADALNVKANGKFTFKTPVDTGTSYKVTVGIQPAAEDCTITGATGIVGSANVTNVAISCVPTHTIGGAVTGLRAGGSLTLLDNGTDALTVTANGKFTFKTPLALGATYKVTVGTQPVGDICRIAHRTGKVTGNVTNISVSCTAVATHTIGGTVSGLKTGDPITLLDNGADALTLTASGPFTFKTPLDTGALYKVTIGAQPPGEDCTVITGTGIVGNANVTTVEVTCSTAGTHTIGGTVSGLKSGASVTLLDNGTDAVKVIANGKFTFNTPLAPGSPYAVTVGTQPAGQLCTITNGAGRVAHTNVTNVTVICTAAPTFTVGGTLSGLAPGALLALFDNGADQLNLTTNGTFTFRLGLQTGSTYNVTVATQPAGETCSVTNGSGAVGTSNVTTVSVSCKANPTFTVGGAVSGLSTGASVTLLDNGNDSLLLSANGAFTFKTALVTGASYNVTIAAQPTGETCSVAGGTGTVGAANVTSVSVSCKPNPTFTIGGTVSGLNSGTSVTLLDNGSDSLTVSANGAFTFKAALATGAAYNVTISTQPTSETCTIANGSGTVASANVTNVTVTCATTTFTVGGSIAGLSSGTSVTLLDNGTDSLSVSANGMFTFKTPLATGAPYRVTISVQPTGETCTITSASGTIASANVTNVTVTCAVNTFTIGGTLSGLNSGNSVTLLDNGTDSLTLSANGAFNFKTALATGATYFVTISAQPTGETCTFANASGTVASTNITNVTVTCAANTFTIGGTVSGLSTGTFVALLDNGSDSLTVSVNGTFTFKTALATGATYNVTIGTQPTGETCTVSNSAGTVASANVTNVAVSCAINTFTIGGTVSGLSSAASVILLDNATDSLAVSANGAFTFKTALAGGAAYNVTVGTQPTGETCTITNGSGTVGSANVTNVAVICSSSTGGGTFWIPYAATPTAAGGSTGLFLMPSNNLESSPAPQFITTTPTQFLGMAFQFTIGNGSVITTPALSVYATAGSDGNTHVYGLKLSDTSGVPSPHQISSLSLPSTQQICSFFQQQTSLADPTTVFTILDVASAPCGTGGDTFEVVHYLDSPTTPPTTVAINNLLAFGLYQDGNLDGLILYDAAAQTLNLYADATFTSPVHLLTGVSSFLGLRTVSLNDGTTFGGTAIYFNATTASGPALYRIDSSALTLTQVHQGVVGDLPAVDNNNLYFTDVTSSTTTVFYQVALAGGMPMVMYSAPNPSAVSSYLLMGSDGSVLAFQLMDAANSPAGTTTNHFYTIPIGVASTTATLIGGPYVGNVTGFVASPHQLDPAGGVLFVTIINKLVTAQTSPYASVALPLSGSGSTNTAPLANSDYPPFGLNNVVQIVGITDMGGGQGGGTLNQVNISTLQNTPFTTTGGGPYIIPSGYTVGVVVIGSNVMAGNLLKFVSPLGPGPGIGLAADLSTNFVLPIPLANTNVTLF